MTTRSPLSRVARVTSELLEVCAPAPCASAMHTSADDEKNLRNFMSEDILSLPVAVESGFSPVGARRPDPNIRLRIGDSERSGPTISGRCSFGVGRYARAYARQRLTECKPNRFPGKITIEQSGRGLENGFPLLTERS